MLPGPVAQGAASPIANPEVMSSIQVWSDIFVEIDHEISFLVFCQSPSADSRRIVVSYKQKYKYML